FKASKGDDKSCEVFLRTAFKSLRLADAAKTAATFGPDLDECCISKSIRVVPSFFRFFGCAYPRGRCVDVADDGLPALGNVAMLNDHPLLAARPIGPTGSQKISPAQGAERGLRLCPQMWTTRNYDIQRYGSC